MTASERVKIIKAITPVLAAEEWPLLDLTLRQFQLPTSNSYGGDSKAAYVVEMIADATDEVLSELALHLGIESTPRPSALEPPFWLEGHLRVFLSHVSAHKKEAAFIQSCLRSFQISAFIAHVDIETTKKWQDEIELALSTADALVAILAPGFHESKWTDQEIGFALGRGLPIVSVRMGQDPYGFLGREQAISGAEVLDAKLAQAIFEVFVKNKQTKKRMAESIVRRFTSSNTFAEAKQNFNLLRQSVYWDKQLSAAVGLAGEQNSQISGSFGLPAKLRRFLKQKNTAD
jgi:hypothetical protein